MATLNHFRRSNAWQKRTYYQITHAGERYLEEKLLEWEVTKDVVEAFVKEMGK